MSMSTIGLVINLRTAKELADSTIPLRDSPRWRNLEARFEAFPRPSCRDGQMPDCDAKGYCRSVEARALIERIRAQVISQIVDDTPCHVGGARLEADLRYARAAADAQCRPDGGRSCDGRSVAGDA